MITNAEFFSLIKHGQIEELQTALAEDPGLVHAQEEGGASAVLTAVYYSEPAIARLLIKYGASLDLFEAAAVGDLEVVRQLVTARPELVNAVASDGFQPLGLAAFFGHRDVAEFLIRSGAAVNSPAQNPLKVMPLHSAAAGSWTEIVRLLIAHGAPVNARQGEDFAPLHSAAQNGSLEILSALLDAGADVNPRDAEGKTPLTYALAEGHEEAAALLRGHGATE